MTNEGENCAEREEKHSQMFTACGAAATKCFGRMSERVQKGRQATWVCFVEVGFYADVLSYDSNQVTYSKRQRYLICSRQ